MDFTYNQTGSIYLNIDNSARYDDGNNVFLVSFNTQLINNIGDPNILEYISLRGFENYSIYDPVFKVLGSSIATLF